MKVAFFAPSLNERGTSVALYDYAHFNETLLGNDSIILTAEQTESAALGRFQQRFRVFRYIDMDGVDTFIRREAIDIVYMLVHGRRDQSPPRLPSGCKLVVHCVFRSTTPFGDVYACISEQVNQRSGTSHPVVPHMVYLPDSDAHLRDDLGIPHDAIVFGRHGGFDTFNIHFVHCIIERILQERDDYYFIFMNTRPFLKRKMRDHPRVIHLPASYDSSYKTAFINTCDAMIHARKGGETFGLAVGEFSIRNKPVLTWDIPKGWASVRYHLWHTLLSPLIPGQQRLPKKADTAHLNILGHKARVYHNAIELYKLIDAFDPISTRKQNWDAYSQSYSPQSVMKLFQKHFLQSEL